MKLPDDYVERVYAGVLGKIIGVYLGRPIEGWSYDRIISELGNITEYVHEKLKVPLIITDDDISGTFTFIKSLSDNGHCIDLPTAEIGNSWLNYLIENRTILWWGGLGNSTEHTAFQRLRSGVEAPRSGSIQLNGKVVAEQIGAQIFIDSWGMISPGNPDLAADFAKRAASVSHDGEAIYGAQVIAAIEAQAFVERDINRLVDAGLAVIPKNSILSKMIHRLRVWNSKYSDWREVRQLIEEHYGYDKFPGNCHIIPNHALIILGLLYGEGNFQKSLMIVNTSGWDTDCNSGNLGCILGIRNGLKAFESGVDWRKPISDRLYVASADGGSVITDAVTETYRLVNMRRHLAKLPALSPKGGVRFHFDLPGSTQGFTAKNGEVSNVTGHSQSGHYSLALRSHGIASFGTPTFIPPDAINMTGYHLMASPTLYSGQKVSAGLTARKKLRANFFIGVYDENDQYEIIQGPEFELPAGKYCEVFWTIPDTNGLPIAEIGFQMPNAGTIYLDYLGWNGEPKALFTRPPGSLLPAPGPQLWRRAWINGVDIWDTWSPEPFRIIQNNDMGLISIGTREWCDYTASTQMTSTLMKSGGLAIRVQGMRRYYALLICRDNKARLIKYKNVIKVLSETDFPWKELEPSELKLKAEDNFLQGWINGVLSFEIRDTDDPILSGGVGLVVEEGTMMASYVAVSPN